MQYRFLLASLVAATAMAAPMEPIILPEETMMLAVTNADQKRMEPLEIAGDPDFPEETMMLAVTNADQKRYEPFEPLDGGAVPEETMMLAVANADQKRSPSSIIPPEEVMMVAVINSDSPAYSPLARRELPEEFMMVAETTPEEPSFSPLTAIAKKTRSEPLEVMMETKINPSQPIFSPETLIAKKARYIPETMMTLETRPSPLSVAIAKKREPIFPITDLPDYSNEGDVDKRSSSLFTPVMMEVVSNPVASPITEAIAKKRSNTLFDPIIMSIETLPKASPVAEKRLTPATEFMMLAEPIETPLSTEIIA